MKVNRKLLARIFTQHMGEGWCVEEARDAAEALDLACADGALPFDICVVDEILSEDPEAAAGRKWPLWSERQSSQRRPCHLLPLDSRRLPVLRRSYGAG